MTNSSIEAITFDIDQTLSNKLSWLEITKGLGASVDKHLEIYQNLKEKKISLTNAIQQLHLTSPFK
jgi:phosphoserine phosphatase